MIFDRFEKLNSLRMEKSIIGLTKKQFSIMSEVFTATYHEIQNERLLNGEIRNLPKGGLPGVLNTPKKMLFFILYYMKTYCTFDALGFAFGFGSGHAYEHIKRIFPILKRTLLTMDVLPVRTISSVEELVQLVEKHGEIMLDGVECACVRPQNDELQKARYSGKKKQHTLKTLVISNSDSRILFVYLIAAGSVHDYNLFKQLFDSKIPWFKDASIFLDLGFYGANSSYGINVKLPHKRKRKSKINPNPKLSKQQVEENTNHARTRIAVEHAIGGMKIFNCLMQRIRNHLSSIIDNFFWLSAGLWNLKKSI
jgi:hypothetical protein